jgi:dihydroorotase
MELFDEHLPLEEKRITAEVCVHHLYFNDSHYAALGNRLKCNPAVKTKNDQDALWKALLENKLDIVATDHAPHTREEKDATYIHAPSGLPLVQHSLQAMMEMHHAGRLSLETLVHKMCHAPAIAFRMKDRGFLREGYFADMVLVDPTGAERVSAENIRYKCGWSPFEGHSFGAKVHATIVNGAVVYREGRLENMENGKRLLFL